ncbi:MAG: ribonuclease P protein component [Chloroflexi bacterium]|nr:ribonuclease P protein component [Chloroflexota bacterium]
MRKEERLTKPQQYASVYHKGISRASTLLVLRALPNGLTLSRFGFSVSKRVGGAVIRNHIKRLLREIVRVMPVKPGWDIVFIVRPPAATADFATLKATVETLLARNGLLESKAEPESLMVSEKRNLETV